ncbi:hypothetical protein ACSTB5_05170 [Faecalibacterium duncaniae]|uniref:hypothetical protein n=1 Tax=Faecalibacterium duncaniae (strain DSM 17677 / JCM 31915 / A2-165) TaxID=411483 RepID=UPI003EDB26E6
MVSIFECERRKDFAKSFADFFEDLRTKITTSSGVNYTVFEYLNRGVRYWPHRCGATGIDNYLKQIGVDITAPHNDKDLLVIFELLINLLYWAVQQDYIDDKNCDFSLSFAKNDVENESNRLIKNAKYILEQCCNMKIREEQDDEFPKYYITKRNVSIDEAAISVPRLADVLLGYYDVRNADNVDAKKAALTAIYAYMEPHRKEYKGLSCGAISEEFFASINTFGIRHNTESQKKMSAKKMVGLCDKLFAMAVYILQTPDVNKSKDALKELRDK